MKRIPWLDAPTRQAGARPAVLQGVVTEILDGGLVRVGLPAEDPQMEAVGPADAGATGIGAQVLVQVSPEGKIQQIASPREIPEDAELVPTGVVGESVSTALQAALEARQLSGQESARIQAVEESLETASTAASSALQAAVNLALSMSELNYAGVEDPGHTKGRLWFQIRDGVPVGVKISDGTTWHPYPLLAENLFVADEQGFLTFADGVVRVNHLQIVPPDGAGGLVLDAQGINIVPAEGEGGTVVSLRSDSENSIAFAKNNQVTFSVSPDGGAVLQQLAVNEGLEYRGRPIDELFTGQRQGMLARSTVLPPTVATLLNEYGLVELSFTVPHSGLRLYEIHIHGMRFGLGGHGVILRARWCTGDTRPTVTCPQAGPEYRSPKSEGWPSVTPNCVLPWIADLPAGTEVSLLLTAQGDGGTIAFHGSGTPEVWVSDEGPAVEATGIVSAGNGNLEGGAVTPPPVTPPKKTIDKYFNAQWQRSYTGSGEIYRDTAAYHGLFLPANGILKSMIGFNHEDVMSFCAGAEITDIQVKLVNSHSYIPAGMTVTWGYHNSPGKPASYSQQASIAAHQFTKGQERWLKIPKSLWPSVKVGHFKGLTLDPGTDDALARYGYFAGLQTQLWIETRK